MDQFARTRRLLGGEGMERLFRAHVALFGVGGVGGYVAEALARSGVGAIDLFDDDRISESNLNRQIIATHSTLGQYKCEAMANRLRDINPAARVAARRMFYLPENADQVDLTRYDYVIDAVDTVSAKLELAVRCRAAGVRLISAMGAGNRLDPARLRICDVYETDGCPLARIMRKELRKRGVTALKVAFSSEPPAPAAVDAEAEEMEEPQAHPRRSTPGSTAFVPAAMGLLIAGEVVRELALG